MVGAIALILVLYMSAVLPVNVAGLALIGLAVALFIIDVYAPTHGVLTFGGMVAFFLGALMLFNRADPAFQLSLATSFRPRCSRRRFSFLSWARACARNFCRSAPARKHARQNAFPRSTRIDTAGGKVFIEGEYWNAVSDSADRSRAARRRLSASMD